MYASPSPGQRKVLYYHIYVVLKNIQCSRNIRNEQISSWFPQSAEKFPGIVPVMSTMWNMGQETTAQRICLKLHFTWRWYRLQELLTVSLRIIPAAVTAQPCVGGSISSKIHLVFIIACFNILSGGFQIALWFDLSLRKKLLKMHLPPAKKLYTDGCLKRNSLFSKTVIKSWHLR